jgi:hypothetical protein
MHSCLVRRTPKPRSRRVTLAFLQSEIIICVEKVVADGPSTQRETSKMLFKAFDAHVKLNQPENYNQGASRTANNYDT